MDDDVNYKNVKWTPIRPTVYDIFESQLIYMSGKNE